MEQTTSHSPKSHTTNSSPASTTVTTPDQSPGADEDIWDTSSDHDQPGLLHLQHSGSGSAGELVGPTGWRGRRRGEILSDLPQLRRQHMTDGYREGLAVGKASVMQEGFDAGYPFGVEIGLRVGVVLGVLEGIVEGLRKPSPPSTTPASSSSISSSSAEVRRSASDRTNATMMANTTTTWKKNLAAAVDGGSSSGRTTDTGRTDDGAGKAAVPDIKFVEQLYEQAKRQLKVSELLKGLDDETVDRMGRVNSPSDPGTDGGERPGTNDENTQSRLLPSAIEETVARWEDMVLGSLAARTAQAEMVGHVSGQHTDTEERTS